MITKKHYIEIAKKFGEFASWAVWAKEGDKPKSNIGDTSIFDLGCNPSLLKQLNPNVIMVGLNFSRKIKKEIFANFHDKRPQGQDYKIRYAFRNTKLYGAYMTDIIKDFEEKISGNVILYLKKDIEFEKQNIALFKKELLALKTKNPLIIAFGNDVYDILNKYFKDEYRIIKVPHYSMRVSREDYKKEVHKIVKNIKNCLG